MEYKRSLQTGILAESWELRTAVLTAEMFARQISGLSTHSTHSAYSRPPTGALMTIDNGIVYQTFANVTSPLQCFFSFINGMFH